MSGGGGRALHMVRRYCPERQGGGFRFCSLCTRPSRFSTRWPQAQTWHWANCLRLSSAENGCYNGGVCMGSASGQSIMVFLCCSVLMMFQHKMREWLWTCLGVTSCEPDGCTTSVSPFANLLLKALMSNASGSRPVLTYSGQAGRHSTSMSKRLYPWRAPASQ